MVRIPGETAENSHSSSSSGGAGAVVSLTIIVVVVVRGWGGTKSRAAVGPVAVNGIVELPPMAVSATLLALAVAVLVVVVEVGLRRKTTTQKTSRI